MNVKKPTACDFHYTEENAALVESLLIHALNGINSAEYPQSTDYDMVSSWAIDMMNYIMQVMLILETAGASLDNSKTPICVDVSKGMSYDFILLLQ